ncbi:DPOD4 polymerase, partial [Sitta europaea]|nr:DPOD4 polymerase [Sitta europaea]
PRRRRRGPGRPPGRLKDKKDKDKKDKVQVKLRDCPRAPSQPPLDPALLEMLRRFDLSWEYGPCTGEHPRLSRLSRWRRAPPDPPLSPRCPAGITRLQRWERAQELGLSPPGPIRDALLEHRDNPDVTYRWVWVGGTG